jgi:hypothetical protein
VRASCHDALNHLRGRGVTPWLNYGPGRPGAAPQMPYITVTPVDDAGLPDVDSDPFDGAGRLVVTLRVLAGAPTKNFPKDTRLIDSKISCIAVQSGTPPRCCRYGV